MYSYEYVGCCSARDLGGHLDTTYRAWGRTLVARVLAVLRVVWLVSALPLDYRSKLRILRAMYIPAALHGVEASNLSQSNFLKLRLLSFELVGLAD